MSTYTAPYRLYGMGVVVTATGRPRMRLSQSVPLTDGFRAEYDAWLLSRFGMEYLIPDGQVFLAGANALVMNPNTYARLRAAAAPFGEPYVGL